MDEHQSGVKLEEALEAKKELDAKAQKILEEKEADSRMRTYTGPLGRAVAVLLCVWTAFQLYFTTIGAISAVNLRAIHCIFLLVFTFLLFPTFKKEKRKRYLLSFYCPNNQRCNFSTFLWIESSFYCVIWWKVKNHPARIRPIHASYREFVQL